MTELFVPPLVAGLLMTSVLALAGSGLLLTGSVWQALAVGQWAAAGGVAASVSGLAPAAVALGPAIVVVGLLRRAPPGERPPMAAFLTGLAATTLLAANFGGASMAAARWADGQIQFVSPAEVAVIAGLAGLSLTLAPLLTRHWLRTQLAPDLFPEGPASRWPWEAGWLVLVIVLGGLTLGLPAAMAGLLLPAWGAAHHARGLRSFLLRTQAISLSGFALAWAISLALDQPFAPVLTLAHAALAAVGHLAPARQQGPGEAR